MPKEQAEKPRSFAWSRIAAAEDLTDFVDLADALSFDHPEGLLTLVDNQALTTRRKQITS